MISATLINTGASRATHWIAVTFPRVLVKDFGVECSFDVGGQRWRAVRGKTRETKTTYRIQATLHGNERVTGNLINESMPNPEPYAVHKWVIDDIADVLPSIDFVPMQPPVLLESSPAHSRWHIKQVTNQGFILEWWADVLHNDPVVQIWGKIVWSDRKDPAPSKVCNAGSIKLHCGEYVVLDFAHRRGITKPIDQRNGKFVITHSENLVLDDGVGIPLTGRMLAFVDPDVSQSSDFSMLQADVDSLLAASTGEMLGICNEWDGHWLAHGKTPDVSAVNNIEEVFSAKYAEFTNQLTQMVGMFSRASDIGIGMTPGQTGAQEDFGATKGTYAVSLGKPEWLLPMRYVSHYELFRSINLYGLSGNKLRAVDHPQWITWSGGTHWHTGASPDRLNKEPNPSWPSNDWYGYDDQHRSQNNFCAYALLSDDPLAYDQMEHQLEIDNASYRIKYPSNGIGASRAVGRQMLTWANMSTVDQRNRWLDLIVRRAYPVSQIESLNPSNELKVLSTGGPDHRKNVYQNGELANWTSLWEAGLAMVGIYAAHKQMPHSEVLLSIMDRLSETLLNKACFEEDGKQYLVADMIWNDGKGAVELSKANGWDGKNTNPQTQEFTYTEGLYGVTEWTFAGILAARNYALSQGRPVPLNVDKLISEVTGGWRSQSHAEWWAM
jgi:hypothetical protein